MDTQQPSTNSSSSSSAPLGTASGNFPSAEEMVEEATRFVEHELAKPAPDIDDGRALATTS